MKRLNNIFTKIIAVSVLFIIGAYSILLSYIYYTDTREVKIVNSVKSIYARYYEPHDIQLIKDGIYSLKKRIDLIRSAKESIELEFFIYELDISSKIVTYELIQAAKRGVKVRVLVDFSIAVFKLAPEYSNYLEGEGVEVRYYNTISNSNFIAVQHRNHRKVLIADGTKVITGGRNIADEYFDLHTKYNFLDYDIIVHGKIVKDIRQSFYHYWESDYATIPDKSDIQIAPNFFDSTDDFKNVYSYFEKNKELFKKEDENIFKCNDIAYTTDYPGVLVSNRQVYKRIEEIVSTTKEDIFVESPYVVLRSDGLELIKSVIDKGANFTILTNSLNSTDAYYTSSALALTLNKLENLGLNLHLFKGQRVSSSFPSIYKTKSNWGIHSKRAVIDNKHIMVGTYNVDPRSANLNSEMIIICRDNKELASAVKSDFNIRLAKTNKLKANDYTIEVLTKNSSFTNKLKFYLSMPIVYFLDFLL